MIPRHPHIVVCSARLLVVTFIRGGWEEHSIRGAAGFPTLFSEELNNFIGHFVLASISSLN